MIFIDSNVLVYALGDDAELAAKATEVLSFAGVAPLRTTGRVIEEFAHVYARRGRGRAVAAAPAGDYAELLAPILFVGEDDLAAGVELWQAYEGLDLADGVLAAMCLALNAGLISADGAFADVPGLDFVDLADPDLFERLQTGT